jgi:ATP-dependent Clp protease ATP-binding subunit ClpB
VKRAIQRYILNDLSKELISGKIDNKHPIVVDYKNNELVFGN